MMGEGLNISSGVEEGSGRLHPSRRDHWQFAVVGGGGMLFVMVCIGLAQGVALLEGVALGWSSTDCSSKHPEFKSQKLHAGS